MLNSGSGSKFIIVKYANQVEGDGAPISESVYGTYTANEVGVEQEIYSSIEEAQDDLAKLKEYNPTVGYGVVRLLKLK